ncbi:MAG: hypothetical protein HZB29_13640 [Nitrospinae bacterium]|nr:hypothetical protein [Nitrospinota bacterium]
MEAEIEVFRSNIILAGSGVFGDEIHRALKNNGAIVKRINPLHGWKKEMGVARDFAAKADCVVVCEHHARSLVLGGKTGLSLKSLAKNEVPVVHISGAMDYESMDRLNIRKIPEKRVAPGVMTVTTAYLGPKPVIDLHTAGLKVGEELVKGMRLTGDPEKAVGIALAHSPAMALRGGPPSNRRS